ncbi:MAG: hypothetical protein GC191_21310 [Azospirillum sp.]|nr:hypothetical protein [Azospirillum sp.]
MSVIDVRNGGRARHWQWTAPVDGASQQATDDPLGIIPYQALSQVNQLRSIVSSDQTPSIKFISLTLTLLTDQKSR